MLNGGASLGGCPACERHAVSANKQGHDIALLVNCSTKTLPPPRQLRPERPNTYLQLSCHAAGSRQSTPQRAVRPAASAPAWFAMRVLHL